jgi:hypothetical protein
MLELLTFHDLGIPFPLLEAPVSDAADYEGRGRCSLCHKEGVHCFQLGIGANVVVRCPGCAAEVVLDADSRSGGACQACKSQLEFPELGPSAILACYSCLRAGRASLTKDTELGMIRRRARCDVRCSRPGSPRLRSRAPVRRLGRRQIADHAGAGADLWVLHHSRRAVALLLQDADGLCRRMVTREILGNGARWQRARILPSDTVHDTIDGLWEDQLHDATGIYVFRCAMCRKYSAHWDMF